MKIREIRNHLEQIAPVALQESYDNSGLLVGNEDMELTKALICLDSTEEVIDEAIAKGCNLVVAHHPIVFRGLKRFNGSDYVQRVVMKAIKHDIAIYAIHTNLDNVLVSGVNGKIAEKLGLDNCKVLAPKTGLMQKLQVFVPLAQKEKVRQAIAEAGAGEIGHYDHCSFESEGVGRFKANEGSKPFVGEKGKVHAEHEVKIEAVFPSYSQGAVLKALFEAHPYEEPAYDIFNSDTINAHNGSGLVGSLKESMTLDQFLAHLKTSMEATVIRYASAGEKKIQKVAVCGGSGSFLLNAAKAQKADVFVTGDFKYHEFFDGEDQVHICDIGHYESEHYTIELLAQIINKKFPNFAVLLTDTNTNPVQYYF